MSFFYFTLKTSVTFLNIFSENTFFQNVLCLCLLLLLSQVFMYTRLASNHVSYQGCHSTSYPFAGIACVQAHHPNLFAGSSGDQTLLHACYVNIIPIKPHSSPSKSSKLRSRIMLNYIFCKQQKALKLILLPCWAFFIHSQISLLSDLNGVGEIKKSENRRWQYIPSQREFADAKQCHQS